MAEALATVGAVASIVQLVDVSAKIIKRLTEYQSFMDEVPKAFRHISIELPVLTTTLSRLQKALESGSIDSDIKAVVVPIIVNCDEAIKSLHVDLEGLMPSAKDSRRQRYAKAFKSVYIESNIEKSIKKVRQLVRDLVFASVALENFKDTRLAKLRKWIHNFRPADPSTFLWSNQRKCHPGTGEWFLASDQYASWKSDPHSLIWLHGIPGCGKSVLSSSVIKDIEERSREDPDQNLAYFYFTFRDDALMDPHGMLISLIAQLAPYCIQLPKRFDNLHASSAYGTQPPGPLTAQELLHLVLEELPETFIVLDALDECRQQDELLEILSTVNQWQVTNLHLLFTSRKERALVDYLIPLFGTKSSQIIQLQSEAVDKDIQTYVHHRLSRSKWKQDKQICEEIERELSRKANGMFRWAAFQMDALGNCITKSQLRQTLRSLPRDLNETYERMLLSVDTKNRPYVISILRWTTFSTHPMRLVDLAEAVAIDYHRNPAFVQDDKIEDPLDILTMCLGLIAPLSMNEGLDDVNFETASGLSTHSEGLEDRTQLRVQYDSQMLVTLAHFSVREYLVSNNILEGPAKDFYLEERASNDALAGCCISYLLHLQPQSKVSDWTSLGEASEFVEYCVVSLLPHTKAAEPNESKIVHLLMKFLCTDNTIYEWWYQNFAPERTDNTTPKPHDKKIPEQLFSASALGLSSLLRMVLGSEYSENAAALPPSKPSPPSEPPSPALFVYYMILAWLVRLIYNISTVFGHNESAANYIGRHPTAPQNIPKDTASSSLVTAITVTGHTALGLASFAGNIAAIDVLLEAGADVDGVSGIEKRTPLQLAIESGKQSAVEYMIKIGAKVSFDRELYEAFTNSRYNIIHALLESESGIEAFRNYKPRPEMPTVMHFVSMNALMQHIPSNEMEATLRLILDIGGRQHIVTRNENFETPVTLMARRQKGKESIVMADMLLRERASYLAKIRSQQDETGQKRDMVEYQHSSTGDIGFHFTAGEGPTVLIDGNIRSPARSKHINDRDSSGNTLLHNASRYEDVDKIRWLLVDEANINAVNAEGWTPLHLSCRWQSNLEACRLLVNSGADVNAIDLQGRTPLDLVIARKSWTLTSRVDLLRSHGARLACELDAKEDDSLFDYYSLFK